MSVDVRQEDASLPLVLCSLLQKEFSGAGSPGVGAIGPMGIAAGIPIPMSTHNRKGGRRGEEQDEEDG